MKRAFTIAEVLITLGIIGIVAAMTLPVLISHHRKSTIEAKLAKFYSVINQAILQSELENGPKEYWDSTFTGWQVDENGNEDRTKLSYPAIWYNRYLRKYLNTVLIKQEISASAKVVAYFADGSCVLISSGSIIFYPFAKDYEVVNEEVGGMYRDKTLAGIKFFDFAWDPEKGIEPYTKGSWDGTRENLLNHSSLGCREDATNERAYCTKLIQMNGWKFPKDYPLKL